MNESQRIADQLHRAFFGRAWHGPAVKEILDGVTAEIAARHSLTPAHSIWEIVHHMRAWMEEAAAIATGKQYEILKGDRDWPPVTDTTAEAWASAVAALEETEVSLERAASDVPPEKLGEGGKSLYNLLHGIVQHNLYHGGQIVLVKRQ